MVPLLLFCPFLKTALERTFFFVLSLSGWAGTCGRDWCKEGTQETHPPATVAAVFMKS